MLNNSVDYHHIKVIRGIRLTHSVNFVDFAVMSPSDWSLLCLLLLTYFYIIQLLLQLNQILYVVLLIFSLIEDTIRHLINWYS